MISGSGGGGGGGVMRVEVTSMNHHCLLTRN